MGRLILIKHSLPEIIPHIPASQWQLSETGKLRCKTLAQKIASYAPDVIVSSTEPKAIETAQIIAAILGKPFQIFDNLHEHDRTGVDFLNKDQFEDKVSAFFNTPETLVMGKESAAQASQRFSQAIAALKENQPDKNIAVVAHGTVITLFTAQATGIEPFSFWKKLGLPSFVVFSLPQQTLEALQENIFE